MNKILWDVVAVVSGAALAQLENFHFNGAKGILDDIKPLKVFSKTM